jgi:ATP-binding cassette subfamily F protein 3
MILSCNNISKSFDGKDILCNCSFHIEDREKAAIVGINGAGKSTLFKIIIGELAPDDGLVTISKDKTLAYLSQHPDIEGNHTIYEEMLDVKKDIIDIENRIRELEIRMKSLDGDELTTMLNTYSTLTHNFELNEGYSYKSEIVGILKGLGFSEDDFNRKIETLSGGQKTRVFLSKILLSKPDIILLDEPTNHLDLNSIAWLENFLLNYKGAVVIISHDRYFLDKIVTKVIEIENTKCSVFSGNYSAYATKKSALREAQLKQYYNQQREIKHQEEVIEKLKSFNREKSIKRAESREKQLDKIHRIDKPSYVDDEMHLKLTPRIISGGDVLTVSSLAKSFDSNTLFSDINFEIKRGEKVGIIGNNGTGKTTILKIINGLLKADKGDVKLGTKVEIGYYDQEHHILTPANTLFDEISEAYPDMTNTEIRNVLAGFLFTGDDVFKQIKELSGGERGRVSLAKLMLSNANFLILDEPTNHLDITSKEILENAINSYEGTILYVSHDRYFINKTATRIIELTNNKIVNYIGNYDYYLEKKDELTAIYASPSTNSISAANSAETVPKAETVSKVDWQTQKEEQAKFRKRQNEFKKTEDKIFELEDTLSSINEKMADPDIASDSVILMELTKECDSINLELEKLYEKWEELSNDI